MPNDREAFPLGTDRRRLTPAHLPAVLLGALFLVAVILGIAQGNIGLQTFHQPVPSTSDPITVP